MNRSVLDDVEAAPRILFKQLPEMRHRPRFMLPSAGGWAVVTWQEFADQVRHTALFLDAFGFHAGERAAIFAPNRVEWAASALAIQAAGGAMVPIYPGNTAEQAAYVIEHSDATVVFVDTTELLERVLRAWPALSQVRTLVLFDDELDVHATLTELRMSGAPNLPDHQDVARRTVYFSEAEAIGALHQREQSDRFETMLDAIDLNAPGIMLYTSGTTGHPKGVPLTHNNVGINGRDWLELQSSRIREGSVDLMWLPMSHIFGYGEMTLGNQLGFTTYMIDPKSVLALLPEVRPNVFMSVPSYWEKLAMAAMNAPDTQRRDALTRVTGGRLEFCLSGGAGLKREIKEFFYDNDILIIEGYGLTECSPTLTLNRPDEFDFGTVGKALPSVELRLADDGEILAKGPNVFNGYHKNPEATAEVFTEDGWFKTGDVGELTETGFLRIVDRKKDIIVTSGGKNIPPANIELRFADEPAVDHVVVFGDGQKYLVAGVWPSEAARQSTDLRAEIEACVERVNGQLARVETIKRFFVAEEPLSVENGLLTPSLKVKRKKVYEAYREQFEKLYEG